MPALFSQAVMFGLVGGLGLFLFGMKIMSEGLQKVAGDRMRKILSALSDNRLTGTLVGLAVTAIIQSSTATTIMVVGFVNAGLMSLVQAIGVVLGANIGTTVTAQIIAFKITRFALPVIGLGAALRLYSRNLRQVYVGEVLLGLGFLFFGLFLMKEAFEPVKGSEEFRNLLQMIGGNHLFGVLLGAVITLAVQSSSATIGLTIAMATSGLLTFEASAALILGENIGTTITANLAALGTNLAARRTALAHFLFNLFGVAFILLLFPFFLKLVASVTPGDPDFVIQTREQAAVWASAVGDKPLIARHIANAHTLFNVVNVLIFLPFVTLLARLTTLLIPGRDVAGEFHLRYIDHRVLNTPPIALGQARGETRRMAHLTLEMLDETLLFLQSPDEKRLPALEKKEKTVDLLQREITDFLVALSQKSISQDTSRDLAAMMHMVNDLERVGDYCEHLWRLGLRKKNQRIVFSDAAMSEIRDLGDKTREFMAFVVAALERRDTTIVERAREMDDAIDRLEEMLRDNHIARLNTGECGVQPGLIFIDMLHNLEKIGDHAFNVAEALGGER